MEIPKQVSRYLLTQELGRGGMGVVCRADDPQLGRAVAIKLILFPPQATEETQVHLEERFAREARAAAGIRHPGVITVFDFGRDGDFLYLVMELIEGESLADRLEQGKRLSRSEAFGLVARVAEGLAAAHAAGVVHRDVTPRNILLANDGRVVVTDFGLARSLGEETHELTRSGMLVGSPRYMAPELVRGRAFDARADVFSLGVILYLMLLDKPPFQGSDITTLLYQIVHEDPLDDPDLRVSLDPESLRCLDRCLAKLPEDRFATASDLARDASRLAARAEGLAMAETATLLVPEIERAPSDEATAGPSYGRPGVALLLIVGLAGAVWFWQQDDDELSSEISDPAETTLVEIEKDSLPAPPILSPGQEETSVEQQLEPEIEPGPIVVVPSHPEPSSPALENRALEMSLTDETRGVAEISDRSPPASASEQLPAPDEPSKIVKEAEIDGVAPVLSIDALPVDLADTSEVVLSGRVLDDQGEVTLTIDNRPVDVTADGSFETARPLVPGRNVWTLVAMDSAGNQTARSVEWTVPVSVPATTAADAVAGSQPPLRQQRIASRFADRGNGTLVDRLTGMMWTKRTAGKAMDWKEGRSYCKDLELGLFQDWILPTVDELQEFYRSAGVESRQRRAASLNFPAVVVWGTKKSRTVAWTFDFGRGQRAEQSLRGDSVPTAQVLCRRRPLGVPSHEGRRPEDTLAPGDGSLNPGGNGPRGSRGGNNRGGGGQGGNGRGGNG